jgi:excinuclease UvrABC nuclease subunit
MGGEAMSWAKATDIKTGAIIYDTRRDGLDEEREEYLVQWEPIIEINLEAVRKALKAYRKRRSKKKKQALLEAIKGLRNARKIFDTATMREFNEENDFQLEKRIGTSPKN